MPRFIKDLKKVLAAAASTYVSTRGTITSYTFVYRNGQALQFNIDRTDPEWVNWASGYTRYSPTAGILYDWHESGNDPINEVINMFCDYEALVDQSDS